MKDCCKKKHREDAEYKALINRLNRIEGQIRGIKGMVENDCYCTEILTQVSAVQAAMDAFSRRLLDEHIRTCVADGIRNGDDIVIDELIETLKRIK